MLSSSLTLHRLTDKQVLSLADILKAGLEHYRDHFSPMESAYLKQLRLLAGLGFTTALIDSDLITLSEPHIKTFIQHQNFKRSENDLYHLSLSAARLIENGLCVSDVTGSYPPYQQIWVDTLKNLFRNVLIDITGKREEAKALESTLFGQTSFF